MTVKKPVIALCTTCLEQFTTEVSMQRHSSEKGHHRYAYTCETRETMTRTEAVAKAEEQLLRASGGLVLAEGEVDPSPRLRWAHESIELANAYVAFAKLCDD